MLKFEVFLAFLAALFEATWCNKPVFDLANNMRVVLLPSDTKRGTIIYKLRASDADEDYPLSFRYNFELSYSKIKFCGSTFLPAL